MFVHMRFCFLLRRDPALGRWIIYFWWGGGLLVRSPVASNDQWTVVFSLPKGMLFYELT